MLFKSSVDLLIYLCILFIIIIKCTNSNKSHLKRSKRDASDYQIRCTEHTTAVDQIFPNIKNQTRKKRFVLFPEFQIYLDDWRYIHNPREFVYWIANFYPNRINTSYIHRCIKDIIQQINNVIDKDIIIKEASDPGEANFHFTFLDYTKCPTDDVSEADIDNIKILESLDIYPVDVTKESRYRAHGGIHLVENDRPISTIKLNMQQKFLSSDDLVYDPAIYTCIEETNECEIDTYFVLLHETLHGFGIEHTTNALNPTPPNEHMQSIMHFSTYRILCHDDIRAIRMVYQLPVKRENAAYDDTCRRDFPMNRLQKLMYLFGKTLIVVLLGLLISSSIAFILTLIYLLIRYLYGQYLNKFDKRMSTTSMNSWLSKDKNSMISNPAKIKTHVYLWHDEMV
ncbi:unnamed protein product [Rotaria socialis]|uniref:Uncharacterized protein n=2 Tax=Rotaria socialis TaxID=392032 RepID=A0A820N454_9BILA|nr:unnamed protein product [Rotaria socialis]CAF3502386.1 unnamed protein product [Rotaria socialis]CAF3638768.1 unnamed protein product [Rotaria socialis]CAF4169439.1 unnamed protein product [Rotaria socialis]CAF4381886.1 unnamed protein product [Rotaria socialis]